MFIRSICFLLLLYHIWLNHVCYYLQSNDCPDDGVVALEESALHDLLVVVSVHAYVSDNGAEKAFLVSSKSPSG